MSSDRARISYDEKQQYRSVVTQQGRVSLESDWNEQGQIVGEEIRKEALDFVGPSGAPGDGYALAKGGGAGTFDLSLSPGALYIGGLRVSLDQALNYGNQPDWLDQGIDPDWVAVPSTTPATKEYVYLLLREQEVSAVEDSALREVALGGPDSAARTRLVQRIVRTPTAQADCPSALNDLLKNHWQQQGLAFDFTTMRLASKATLTLAFDTAKTSSDPCQPQSAGGYLGAENQLIQVKICYADNTKKTYKLLWGYDNASYLYRVSDLSSNQQLLLNTQPVDSFHQPAKNQAVEVLLAAAQLPNGEYVATDHGFATLLSANYDPNLQAVALTDPLPAGYPQNHASYLNSPPIFLRVWQEEISFVPGTSVPLGGTGLNVTLNADPNGLFHIGDYWVFAVRPGTPASNQVYPARYNSNTPQPPDGPRLWACPLALVDWQATPGVLDCRNHFDSLVVLTRRKLGGCCTVTVRPEDLSDKVTLQTIIDQYKSQDRINICLTPGVYPLNAPLVLGPEHSNLTLSGCHDGVFLQAQTGSEDAFLDGLVVVNRANNVSFKQIGFTLPQANFGVIGQLQAQVVIGLSGERGRRESVSPGGGGGGGVPDRGGIIGVGHPEGAVPIVLGGAGAGGDLDLRGLHAGEVVGFGSGDLDGGRRDGGIGRRPGDRARRRRNVDVKADDVGARDGGHADIACARPIGLEGVILGAGLEFHGMAHVGGPVDRREVAPRGAGVGGLPGRSGQRVGGEGYPTPIIGIAILKVRQADLDIFDAGGCGIGVGIGAA